MHATMNDLEPFSLKGASRAQPLGRESGVLVTEVDLFDS
jgi:hypothetical protein